MLTVITTILGTFVLVLMCFLGFIVADGAGWLNPVNTPGSHADASENCGAAESKKQRLWYRSPLIIALIIISSAVWLMHSAFCKEMSVVQNVLDAILLAFMTLLCVIDLRCRRVPNRLLLAMLLLWFTGVGIHALLNRLGALEQLFRGAAGMFV